MKEIKVYQKTNWIKKHRLFLWLAAGFVLVLILFILCVNETAKALLSVS